MHRVRFDDRIATVMALPGTSGAARAAKWRQLVDLLAQRRDTEPSEEVDQAYSFLIAHRDDVDFFTRQEVARSLTGRDIAPGLLGFFAEDHPAVAAPIVAGARLTEEEWIELLPAMSPTARSLLRHRRDLGRMVEHALTSFGSIDFVLSGTVDASAPKIRRAEPRPGAQAEGGEAQIRELVARIEAFRKTRVDAQRDPDPVAATSVEAFRWETGSDGVILWVEGAPRGPLVGQSIANIAERGQHGVDGQAAGAFERRAPFRDARFSVAGSGAASGDWRISGVPFFDPRSGAFMGYRGSTRRPRVDEVARAQPPVAETSGLFGTDLQADSLRQLIHELRTPLNAIIGFSELIEGQHMGPADIHYRSRASEIMEQASRLLSAVDDLDTAARIETSRMSFDQGSVDAVALLCRLHDAYERVADQRNSRIAIEITRDLPPAKVEQGAAERMFARMLAATIGLAQEGETIAATMSLGDLGRRRMLCLAIDRPRAIAGLDEAALLDPGYSPEGDWPGAPALGLGFALRLVRNLAEAVGGALVIGERRFALYLPPLGAPERSTGQGS
ncbi:sensor histidine kinase [Allosphingosinicella sp.]|jgi:signal transduction histidine kinase|uniref:sensor histidine kinase n=1 Tax=Allosphingosinicella sp. TaxID=2823234 RepID=UPI003D762188